METRIHSPNLRLAALLLLALAPRGARADEPPGKPDESAPAKPAEPQKPAEPAAAAKPEEAPPTVEHTPIGTIAAGRSWTIPARITAAHRLSDVWLHYRRRGETAFHGAKFNRAPEGDYAAVVPEPDIQPGVMEYYIGSTSAEAPDGPERLHFASPAAPHPLIVTGDSEARFKDELLARHLGRRSRFSLLGEYVDFGGRTLTLEGGTKGIRDHFWHGRLDYTYRILSWVYSIRLGVGILRGDSYVTQDAAAEIYIPPPSPVGLAYGFAELRFRFGRLVRLDVKATLGASGGGFDGGGGGQLIIGYDPGTHFAMGVEGVTRVGVRAWLRLAWNTVPKVPMSFTLETTNFPVAADFAGRVYFSAAYRFSRYFSMNASLGYAARDKQIGGPSVALGADLEF